MARTDNSFRHNLRLRLTSALVLIPLALTAAYIGGWVFAALCAVACAAIVYEWLSLVRGATANWLLALASWLLVPMLLAGYAIGGTLAAMALLAVAAGIGGLSARQQQRAWVIGGFCYAGTLLICALMLRNDAELGFAAIILLFAVVWTTENAGYFVGWAIGGPKLVPQLSPKKTWSGAIAATIMGSIAGFLVLHAFTIAHPLSGAATGGVLSIAAQAGDLFESAIKRHFGVKDASTLIPGHGGVMDRVDGLWAATLCAALIGIIRAGFTAPARGLLLC
jgi:phosphatidate cytidylyltransferase